MAMRLDEKGMLDNGFGPEQLKKFQLLLASGGNLGDLNLPTTTLDYDKIADRNVGAALWVMAGFWVFIVVLLVVLSVVGLRTYCYVWAKPRRLAQEKEDLYLV